MREVRSRVTGVNPVTRQSGSRRDPLAGSQHPFRHAPAMVAVRLLLFDANSVLPVQNLLCARRFENAVLHEPNRLTMLT